MSSLSITSPPCLGRVLGNKDDALAGAGPVFSQSAQCMCGDIRHKGCCRVRRLQEHRQTLKKGNVTASAVAEHVFEPGHQLDLSKTLVIDYHPHNQTLCLLESWHIQHLQAPLNKGPHARTLCNSTGLKSLPLIFSPLPVMCNLT